MLGVCQRHSTSTLSQLRKAHSLFQTTANQRRRDVIISSPAGGQEDEAGRRIPELDRFFLFFTAHVHSGDCTEHGKTVRMRATSEALVLLLICAAEPDPGPALWRMRLAVFPWAVG